MSVESIADQEPQLNSNNRIVQGLWIGSALSVMERLSISSFLKNGHDYHLYTYNDLPNVPAGTVMRDAREILPSSAIFQYKDRPSYAGFANFFRYKLLLERGGWWVDTDVVCLRPFDFPEEHVFSTEIMFARQEVTSGIIKAPAGSEAMARAWRVCQRKNPNKLVWGETGPKLMAEVVRECHLDRYQKPYYIFCPIVDWHKLIEPYVAALPEAAYAVHLWHSLWQLAKQDKEATYHPACIYEQLKAKYL